MNFKVGDKVRALPNHVYTITVDGWEGEVVRILPGYIDNIEVRGLDAKKDTFSVNSQYFELIKKGFMTKLNNMMKQLLDSQTQILVKAGYINGDLELTEKGQKALYSTLFIANKATLVTMAQADLDEEAKKD